MKHTHYEWRWKKKKENYARWSLSRGILKTKRAPDFSHRTGDEKKKLKLKLNPQHSAVVIIIAHIHIHTHTHTLIIITHPENFVVATAWRYETFRNDT